MMTPKQFDADLIGRVALEMRERMSLAEMKEAALAIGSIFYERGASNRRHRGKITSVRHVKLFREAWIAGWQHEDEKMKMEARNAKRGRSRKRR